MHTLEVSLVVVLGVLFGNVHDVQAQPLPISHQLTVAWSPYAIMRVPSVHYQEPNASNQAQSAQYRQQEYNQQVIYQPSTFSMSAVNQVPSVRYNQLQYTRPSNARMSTINEIQPTEYRQHGYFQPSTVSDGAESTSNANQESTAEYHQRDFGTYQENISTEASRIREPQTPDVVHFQRYRHPELPTALLSEYEEEYTQTEPPLYDGELLENYYLQPEESQKPEDSTTKYELIPPTRNATVRSEPPQQYSTHNKTAQYETLRKPNIFNPPTPKQKVLSKQYQNYTIPFPANPNKYLQVA